MISERLPLEELLGQLGALVSGEPDLVANAANCAALLWQDFDDINWLGFYFLQGEELVLGPFQGKPACVRIPVGRVWWCFLRAAIRFRVSTSMTSITTAVTTRSGRLTVSPRRPTRC